jgi:hypothetical protein
MELLRKWWRSGVAKYLSRVLEFGKFMSVKRNKGIKYRKYEYSGRYFYILRFTYSKGD